MFDSSQQYDEDGESDTSSVYDERSLLRISTAPPRPLTELEDFKRSNEFSLIEQAIICSQQLQQKNPQKCDLDSQEGQKLCKKYLNLIERICESLQVQTTSREYRNDFSKAYKILYKDGQLCYLTEILDSAQEGFPYLWVNGEKYMFSPEVLEAGQKLLSSFYKLQHVMRNAYSRLCSENVNVNPKQIKQEIIQTLEDFDYSWGNFEKELMLIENDARRYVMKAIVIEKELESIEIRERAKGKIILISEDYINLKKKLCKIISSINSVANMEGKGRDDLSYDILSEAEGVLRRVTNEQSFAVRNLAQQIRKCFQKFRALLKKYEQNIEIVDPQLKNNQDLVETLMEYEQSWEKGKNYLLDPQKQIYLIHFSHIIEATSEKYSEFKEAIDCRDADIFINIPCLLILKCLEKEDKNICQYFLPQMFENGTKLNNTFKELSKNFQVWKNSHNQFYVYYNLLEKIFLNITLTNKDLQAVQEQKSNVDYIVKTIKELAIDISRCNPQQWNQFFDAAIV